MWSIDSETITVFGKTFPKKHAIAVAAIICVLLIVALVGGCSYCTAAATPEGSYATTQEDAADSEAGESDVAAEEAGSTAEVDAEADGDAGAAANSATSGTDTDAAAKTGDSNGSSDKNSSGKAGNASSGSNGGNGSLSSSGKSESSPHKHTWVDQTVKVHHDAVTHRVWHDAVRESRYICNHCGADITADPWGHIDASLLNGGNCGGYHQSYVTVKRGYYETVTDKAAYDETVVVGSKCSTCGATK